MGPRHGGQEAACFPGLTLESVRQKAGPVAQRFRTGRRVPAELGHAAGDDRGDVIQHLGRFLLQQVQRLRAEGQTVPAHKGHGLRRCGAVRIGGAGGDHIRGISDDVGEEDGIHMGRGAELGEPPALDAGEPLADGVDLGDVRAAGQHLAGDVLQLRQRHQRALKQGGAASGHQKQHPVPCAEAADRRQRRFRGPDGMFIRYGMARLVNGQITDGALAVAVFRHHHALFDGAAQRVVSGFCGLPPGFADGDQHRPPLTGGQLGQRPLNGGVRHRGFNGAAADVLRVPAEDLQGFAVHRQIPLS